CRPLAGAGVYFARLLTFFSFSSFSLVLIYPCGRGGVREHPRTRTRTSATEPANAVPSCSTTLYQRFSCVTWIRLPQVSSSMAIFEAVTSVGGIVNSAPHVFIRS